PLSVLASKEKQVEYVKRVPQIDPDSGLFLSWFTAIAPPEEVLQFMAPRLEARPLLVEWHRSYQTLMEREHPEVDLRARYRQLAADLKDAACAVYLYGRVEEPSERPKLYERAAAANPPCPAAFQGLGYIALSEGRFADAVRWMEKAEKAQLRNIATD